MPTQLLVGFVQIFYSILPQRGHDNTMTLHWNFRQIKDFDELKHCVSNDTSRKTITGCLQCACKYGNMDAVVFLVERGADVTAQDNSAVCWAAANGHLHVVKYLAEKGADVTAMDNSAVRWAAAHGHLHVVEYLVERGADVTAMDNSAVREASSINHVDVVYFLVGRGAPIELVTERNRRYIEIRRRNEVKAANIIRFWWIDILYGRKDKSGEYVMAGKLWDNLLCP